MSQRSKKNIYIYGNHTMCVKNCDFPNQSIIMIILFSCLVGWLDPLPVEI